MSGTVEAVNLDEYLSAKRNEKGILDCMNILHERLNKMNEKMNIVIERVKMIEDSHYKKIVQPSIRHPIKQEQLFNYRRKWQALTRELIN